MLEKLLYPWARFAHTLPTGTARLGDHDPVVILGATRDSSLGGALIHQLQNDKRLVIVVDHQAPAKDGDMVVRDAQAEYGIHYVRCDLADDRTDYATVWSEVMSTITQHCRDRTAVPIPHVFINAGVIMDGEQVNSRSFIRRLWRINRHGPAEFLRAYRLYRQVTGNTSPVAIGCASSISTLPIASPAVREYAESKKALVEAVRQHCIMAGDTPVVMIIPHMDGSGMDQITQVGALHMEAAHALTPTRYRSTPTEVAIATVRSFRMGRPVTLPVPFSLDGKILVLLATYMPRIAAIITMKMGYGMLDKGRLKDAPGISKERIIMGRPAGFGAEPVHTD